MDYIVVGINHKTAPIDVRERLAFPAESLDDALGELTSQEGIDEGVILSTCNRVEIYATSSDDEKGIESIKSFLSNTRDIQADAIEPHLYNFKAEHAVRHMFRVASSIDSMIVGETQISSQLKRAYDHALQNQSTGVLLNPCMSRALYVAKKVRTETEISSRAVSVGATAADLAKKIFDNLSGRKVALVGAGENAELVLDHLKGDGADNIAILNRTLEKAEGLIKDGIGKAYHLDELWNVIQDADVVVASIEKSSPYITHSKVKDIMKKRHNAPLFFIDLGVPRNVDPSISTLNNVYLYNVDDLDSVINENKGFRHQEAIKAEEIINKEALEFYKSVSSQYRTIALLGKKAEEIRVHELHKTLVQMKNLSPKEQSMIEKCTEVIVKKILHDPIVTLKSEEAHEGEWDAHSLFKKLFKLE